MWRAIKPTAIEWEPVRPNNWRVDLERFHLQSFKIETFNLAIADGGATHKKRTKRWNGLIALWVFKSSTDEKVLEGLLKSFEVSLVRWKFYEITFEEALLWYVTGKKPPKWLKMTKKSSGAQKLPNRIFLFSCNSISGSSADSGRSQKKWLEFKIDENFKNFDFENFQTSP